MKYRTCGIAKIAFYLFICKEKVSICQNGHEKRTQGRVVLRPIMSFVKCVILI